MVNDFGFSVAMTPAIAAAPVPFAGTICFAPTVVLDALCASMREEVPLPVVPCSAHDLESAVKLITSLVSPDLCSLLPNTTDQVESVAAAWREREDATRYGRKVPSHQYLDLLALARAGNHAKLKEAMSILSEDK